MAPINEEKLAKLIKDGVKQNIWLLFGNDIFLKDLYCDRLVKATVNESLKAFNLRVFNDEEADIGEILAAADILPVMSERTCVLVRNFPLASLRKDEIAELENGLRDMSETTVLIFFFGTINFEYGKKDFQKWTDIVNLVSKYGICAQLDKRTPERTAKILVARAKDRNTRISAEDARYLVDTVGGDMQTVQNEFNKVCSFADGKPVTREMIDEVCTKSIEASVFDISKCIFGGDIDRAYKLMNELLRQKTPLPAIIGAMASAFVNAYRFKLALNADRSPAEFKETFKYYGNLSEISSFVRATKLSSLKECITVLLDADAKSKSTSTDAAILLTELTARLAAAVK